LRDDLEAVVDAAYEAAVVPELWSGVLDGLARLSGARGGLLLTTNIDHDFRWLESACMSGCAEAFSQEGWGARNPRGARLAPMRYPGFVTDAMLFTEQEMDEDPFYSDFLARFGLRYGAGTMVQIPSGDILAITVEGSHPISAEAVVRLDAVRPHLARAAVLSARLRLERARTAIDTLEKVGLPAAAVRPNGRVVLANRLLEKLDGSICILPFDRLASLHPASNEMLSCALGNIRHGRLSDVRSIPVPGCDLNPPVVVHVLPVLGVAHDVFADALAIVIVTPVVMPGVHCADMLDTLFDLTPSEGRLTALIGSGLTPRLAAEKLNITEETARSTLKRVFSKVGVSRQSELTALLGSLLLRAPD
jgi:DNA-binding CsgD family transcriptional regulator